MTSCSPQFLLIVPLTPFPLGNFQPWDGDNYWKPLWGQGVLGSKRVSFWSDWAALSPRCSPIGPNRHQSAHVQVLLKFETFLRAGGIRLQQTPVTDLTARREKNTLSIIYTFVPDTRLHFEKEGQETSSYFKPEIQQPKTCCEENLSVLQDEDLSVGSD